MSDNFDFKKEWVKIKGNLDKFSREFSALAKQGEKEVVKITSLGKLQVDSTAIILKKEHILHLIGKEYIKMKCPGTKSARMKELLVELNELNKSHRRTKQAIKLIKK